MRHIKNLSGVFPPVATPFKNEQIALEKLAENILKYNATDLKGYMILGSNGDACALRREVEGKELTHGRE